MDQELLTPMEVAVHLDVCYQTVLNYIKRGQLQAIRYGGKWKIPPTELKRFIKEGNVDEDRKK